MAEKIFTTIIQSDQPFEELQPQQPQQPQQTQLEKEEKKFKDEGGITFSIMRMSLYGDAIE